MKLAVLGSTFLSFLALKAAILIVVASGQQDKNPTKQPNIIFLVCESTDGRTWREGYQNGAIPLPNIHQLASMNGGASFHRHYSNSPVCCPSRATMWSGRHAHHIPHLHNGIDVGGAWNNYEGLPLDYTNRLDQILSKDGGYDVLMSGKKDWTAGGHSLNVRLESWTRQVQFPYDMNRTGGWRYDYDQICRSNGTVVPGNRSAHEGDWETLEKTVGWIKNRTIKDGGASDTKPFFVYQGMNIVHPPYVTNEYWYSRIDPRKVEVPTWADLDELHPCDLQSSMVKGCVPSYEERDFVQNHYRKRNVRRIYYAMIAEFDAMVGRYMDAVREAGLDDNTIFIVTSDHGDMQMEHQQTFKQVPYDASSSVPMVIYDPRHKTNPALVVSEPTQLIDIFPTVLQYAGIDGAKWPAKVDGQSLLPLVNPVSTKSPSRIGSNGGWDRSFIVSQYHGEHTAMSWFLIVKALPLNGRVYKLVQYGTGAEMPSQLFDLTSDPDEMVNLAPDPLHIKIMEDLDSSLRSVVDYPSVARDVARYDKTSFRWWITNVTDWKDRIRDKGLRWSHSWEEDPDGAFKALEDWFSLPDSDIYPCRSATKWPISVQSGADLSAI